MINSLSAETEKMKQLLPVVANANCDVIVMCVKDNGISKEVDAA